MKPEQFIREFGVEKAKKIIDKAANGTTHIHSVTLQNYMQGEGNNYVWCGSGRDGWYFSIYDTLNGMMVLEDLKRLVESLNRIEKFGGINEARNFAGSSLYFTADRERMYRAIKDHESIYVTEGASHE